MGQAAGSMTHLDHDITHLESQRKVCVTECREQQEVPLREGGQAGSWGPLQAQGWRLGFVSKLLESAFQNNFFLTNV